MKAQKNTKGGIFSMKILSFLWRHSFPVGVILLLIIMHLPLFPSVDAFIIKHLSLRIALHLITWPFFLKGLSKFNPDRKKEDLIFGLLFAFGMFAYAWRW
jgi:hypothetical protein